MGGEKSRGWSIFQPDGNGVPVKKDDGVGVTVFPSAAFRAGAGDGTWRFLRRPRFVVRSSG
jgi:hypothetical protein